jgi:hypothetical protein
MDEICFAAEGLSGTAAAASLRKLGTIMERAPSGRLFGAIATLSDLSARAALSLEDGSRALDRSAVTEAQARIGDALAEMDELAAGALDVKPGRRARR